MATMHNVTLVDRYGDPYTVEVYAETFAEAERHARTLYPDSHIPRDGRMVIEDEPPIVFDPLSRYMNFA